MTVWLTTEGLKYMVPYLRHDSVDHPATSSEGGHGVCVCARQGRFLPEKHWERLNLPETNVVLVCCANLHLSSDVGRAVDVSVFECAMLQRDFQLLQYY